MLHVSAEILRGFVAQTSGIIQDHKGVLREIFPCSLLQRKGLGKVFFGPGSKTRKALADGAAYQNFKHQLFRKLAGRLSPSPPAPAASWPHPPR